MKALSVNNLSKTYANGTQALNGVSFAVQEGDFFALLGPNGAGKSTTIGIITSLVNKTAGQVSVFNHDLDNERSQVKRHIGLVPQEFNFNIFEKVWDIVLNQGGYYGLSRKQCKPLAEKYLRLLDLWDQRFKVSRVLSGGMKRRLMIARALVHNPKLLILDEPTAGVDIEIRRNMWAFLRQINSEGITVILTTHYLEEAEQLCRNIAIIDNGEIIENTSMRSLLEKLHTESFILDLDTPIHTAPVITGFPCQLLDERSLLVEVNKQQRMNDLFDALSKQNIHVLSMRNKANRLEELFVKLISESGHRQNNNPPPDVQAAAVESS